MFHYLIDLYLIFFPRIHYMNILDIGIHIFYCNMAHGCVCKALEIKPGPKCFQSVWSLYSKINFFLEMYMPIVLNCVMHWA